MASQEHDIENAQDFSSRQSQYRATKRVKENLPETPSKKAKIIEKLIESPRTNEILSSREITNTPVTKRKLDMYDELSKSLKNHYNEIKPKGRPTNTKFAARVLLQEIVHKTGKYGLKTELQRKLKIRHRRSSKAHSQQTESKWWAPRQKRRKDQISNEIKESVQNFFLAPDISREVPDKRAAIKIQDGAKKRLVQRHYMTLTMKDAFDIYRNLYPENKIGFTKFTILRPQQVKKVSETNRKTCLCPLCCNIALKIEAVKSYCRKECPSQFAKSVKTKKELINSTLSNRRTSRRSQHLMSGKAV